MSEQDPGSHPGFRERRTSAPVSAELYEKMWEVYKDGDRTRAELVRKFGVNHATAAKAIERGWPDRALRPLKERAREADMHRAELERQAEYDRHREATDAWYKAGKQFNRVADNAVTFCMLAMQQVSQLTTVRTPNGVQLRPLTKHVRRRVVDLVDGKRVVNYYDEEVPLTTSEAVKLQTNVLKAAAMAGAFKRLWPTTTDAEKAAAGPPQGLASLTVEELDYINETGQLPEGKTAEDVFGWQVPGFPSKKDKKQTH